MANLKNLKGNKNSGRKTDAEIVAKYINNGLANFIMNEELLKIKNMGKRPPILVKDLVLPVVLKGMTEKKQIDGSLEIKQITGMEILKDENPV
jgi:hypothetical protein